MSEARPDDRGRDEEVAAVDLVCGDVALIDGQAVRVERDPHTYHRGWSLFDAFELLLAIPCRPLDDQRPRVITVQPDCRVRLLQRAEHHGPSA